MGQIVGLKAKPKRCNLNKLSQLGIPDAGEYILVSYDNSMTANGQGNFDRYIMGDGRTAATALELKYLDDSTRPYIVEEVNKAVADIQPIEITGDVTNAPDEEDLTSENQGGTDVLKFKDKAYNSALYSGLGRVYLRKNIVTLEGTGKNVLTQAMVNTANTIYHIQYDYDLNGQTITLPAGCVLEFVGGSLANGTIVFNGTIIKAEGIAFKSNITISTSSTLAGDVKVGWFAGVENDSIKLNTLLNSGADNIYLDKKVYHVHGTQRVQDEEMVDSQDNTYRKYNIGSEWLFCLLLNNIASKIHWNGATLQQDAESTSTCPVIGLINCHNIEISNLTIIGDKLIHLITTGQWCHGIAILPDCDNIEIHDATIKENYGDSICLVNNSTNEEQATFYAKNISIHDCIFGNTIRNNISVISGEYIYITDNVFNRIDNDLNADRTALVTDCNAQLFVDIEQNYTWQICKNIQITNNVMRSNKMAAHNTSAGISASSGINDNITINGNTITNCYYYAIGFGGVNTDAKFYITNNVIDGVYEGTEHAALRSVYKTKTILKDCVVKNAPIALIGTNYITDSGEYFYFPHYSELRFVDCTFVDTLDSSLYKGIFDNCQFINSNGLVFINSVADNCIFDNVKSIKLEHIPELTDANKTKILEHRNSLISLGFEVNEDGSLPNYNTGNIFNGCDFKNSAPTGYYITSSSWSPVVFRQCSFDNIITNYSIFYVNYYSTRLEFDGIITNRTNSAIIRVTSGLSSMPILINNFIVNNIVALSASSGNKVIEILSGADVTISDLHIYYNTSLYTSSINYNSYISVAGVTSYTLISAYLYCNYNVAQRVIGNIITNATTIKGLFVNNSQIYGALAGATGSRYSSKGVGCFYFDTTLNKPIWWNGSNWVDATGATV